MSRILYTGFEGPWNHAAGTLTLTNPDSTDYVTEVYTNQGVTFCSHNAATVPSYLNSTIPTSLTSDTRIQHDSTANTINPKTGNGSQLSHSYTDYWGRYYPAFYIESTLLDSLSSGVGASWFSKRNNVTDEFWTHTNGRVFALESDNVLFDIRLTNGDGGTLTTTNNFQFKVAIDGVVLATKNFTIPSTARWLFQQAGCYTIGTSAVMYASFNGYTISHTIASAINVTSDRVWFGCGYSGADPSSRVYMDDVAINKITSYDSNDTEVIPGPYKFWNASSQSVPEYSYEGWSAVGTNYSPASALLDYSSSTSARSQLPNQKVGFKLPTRAALLSSLSGEVGIDIASFNVVAQEIESSKQTSLAAIVSSIGDGTSRQNTFSVPIAPGNRSVTIFHKGGTNDFSSTELEKIYVALNVGE